MKIVITGPTGAIGIALIRKCIERKIKVLAICHKNSARIKNIPSNELITVVEADLSQLSHIKQNIDEKYDVFYHLAWAGTVGAARNDMYLQNENVKYTLDAVELAKRLGCHTFIGAGSQAEYGRVNELLTPQTPVWPENGYGMAKLCAGQMSRQLCESIGIRHIWVRILSVYGPYDGENSMISNTIKVLLEGGRASFTLGEQKWDYLYSEDAAEALLLLASKGKSEKIYVLGSGNVRTLKEYIEEIYRVICDYSSTPGSLGIGDIAYAEKQIMYLGADISELTKDTGFVPKTAFETGIRNILSMMKGNLKNE